MSELGQTERVATTDRVLRMLRALGLTGLLGGLAALSAMWAFGRPATTLEQWHVLVSAMRAVFYACVFTGILILVPVGLILWWRRRIALRGQRWFRLLTWMLILSIPALHISARLTSLKLHDAVESGDLLRIEALWNRLGWIFLFAFVAMLGAAFVAIAKPRLGQRRAIQSQRG